MKRRLNSLKDLETEGLLTPTGKLERVAGTYAIGLTGSVIQTMGGNPATDPIAKQYLPDERELITSPDERNDPIGDRTHTPVPGIVHRYPDRVLLKAASACAVYCRYCFRREMIGPGSETLSATDLKNALEYIRARKEIWEVILTGGDPLILSPAKIGHILDELENIKHIKILRIHTRVPLADFSRLTEAHFTALTRAKPLYIVLHINHANELSPGALEAIKNLQQAGCTLLSQSVLLKGVNDDAQILETLFRRLVELKIKPYYLHHPDLAPGTSHFRVPIEKGQQIMKALRGNLSGLCLPEYMLDIPGGHGKVPLTPCYIENLGDAYTLVDYQGRKHCYKDF